MTEPDVALEVERLRRVAEAEAYANGVGDPIAAGHAYDGTPVGDADTVIDRAARIVDGERESTYGHPGIHFTTTGRQWGALISAGLGIVCPDLPADLVGLMFAADKMTRLCKTTGHEDSLDDIVGHTRCVERVCRDGYVPDYDA